MCLGRFSGTEHHAYGRGEVIMFFKRFGKRFAALVGTTALVGGFSGGSQAAVVINEVFPGGGSSAATTSYTRDFVELFNTGTSAVDLTGYRLQYFSASGTTPTTIFSFLSGSAIGANDSLLVVTGGSGSAGTTLTGTGPDGTNGTGSGASLQAQNGAVRLIDPSSNVVDLLGYGAVTTTNFEGTLAPAGPSTNDKSFQRDATTHADTNNNFNDFTLATPTPNPGTTSTAVNTVPEPTAMALLGLAGAFTLARRRR
jgi:hypothetical protein